MVINFTVRRIAWMYIVRKPAYIFFGIVSWILSLPFFGLTDGCPEEIRARLTLAVYFYLSCYYAIYTLALTFIEDIQNDEQYEFSAMTVSLSSIIISANINLACF